MKTKSQNGVGRATSMKSPRQVRRTRPADSVEPRFSRGTLEYPPSVASFAKQSGYSGAIREADQLAGDVQSGAVTREDLVRTGRAFSSGDDWLKEVA